MPNEIKARVGAILDDKASLEHVVAKLQVLLRDCLREAQEAGTSAYELTQDLTSAFFDSVHRRSLLALDPWVETSGSRGKVAGAVHYVELRLQEWPHDIVAAL